MKCICGSAIAAASCCEQFIQKRALPSTPEQLMRSRFVAFVTCQVDYILETEKLDEEKDFDAVMHSCKISNWSDLTVLGTKTKGNVGFVKFKAINDKNVDPMIMKETSTFHKINGQWFYVSGEATYTKPPVKSSKKVNRNAPCPCGSGKKYKKCCL